MPERWIIKVDGLVTLAGTTRKVPRPWVPRVTVPAETLVWAPVVCQRNMVFGPPPPSTVTLRGVPAGTPWCMAFGCANHIAGPASTGPSPKALVAHLTRGALSSMARTTTTAKAAIRGGRMEDRSISGRADQARGTGDGEEGASCRQRNPPSFQCTDRRSVAVGDASSIAGIWVTVGELAVQA